MNSIKESSSILIEMHNVRTYLYTYRGVVRALEGVDLKIDKGINYGLAGETGCGKSMTALSILRLVPPPGKIIDGKIIFKNEDLLTKSEEEMRKIRGKEISMIFQEPMTSLDPVFSVGEQLVDVIMSHEVMNREKAKERAIEVLRLVNMPNPEALMNQYPHELSCGMRQRVMIGAAVSCRPSMLIADEPTSALDVTIQAKIMNLIKEMVKKLNMSMLLITHNLGVIRHECDRTAVMYSGCIVEDADTEKLFRNPIHPYTQSLIKTVPSLSEKRHKLPFIRGSVPNLIDPPSGCRFHPRCDYCMEICKIKSPPRVEITPGHFIRCYRA